MYKYFFITALLIVGCSQEVFGPATNQLDNAMSMCWENALGMEHETRPQITWQTSQCDNIITPQAQINMPGWCFDYTIHSNGQAEIVWRGYLSQGKGFVGALTQWRNWLVYTSWDRPDDNNTESGLLGLLVRAGL